MRHAYLVCALFVTTGALAEPPADGQRSKDDLYEEVYQARAVSLRVQPLDLEGLQPRDASTLRRIDDWLTDLDDAALAAVLRQLLHHAVEGLRAGRRDLYCAALRDLREAAKGAGIRPHTKDDDRTYVHQGTERRGRKVHRVLRIPRTCK